MISDAREKAIREYLRRSENLLAPNDLEKGMESAVRDLLADRDEQKERIAALEEALKWYADDSRYGMDSSTNGAVARSALQEKQRS